MAVVAGVATLAPVAVGTSALGALVGLDTSNPNNQTVFSNSSKHVTTVQRTDLPDAPATECEAPATDPVKVSETSQALDPTVAVNTYVGPQTIHIGEDQQTAFDLAGGQVDIDVLTTYETVLSQYFQATAAGEACAVVAAARFTG